MSGLDWALFFLPMDFLFLQHHLLKRLALLHLIAFAPLSNISWAYCLDLFLGSLFCYMDVCICPSAKITLSWLLQLYSKPVPWEKWFLPLCLVFQNYFGYSRTFLFSYYFRISLSISLSKLAEILIGIAFNI